MRIDRRRRIRTGSRESGASLVEFALLLPVFVTLIFGMISGGIVLSQQNSVKNAVRETSRFAAVTDTGTTNAEIQTYLGKVITQVEQSATGDLGPTVDGRDICVAYNSGTTFHWRRVVGTNPATSGTGATGCDLAAPGDTSTGERVQIRAQRRAEIDLIFFTVPVDLSSQSVSRYEL